MNATVPQTLFFENLVYGVHENSYAMPLVLSNGVVRGSVCTYTINAKTLVIASEPSAFDSASGQDAALPLFVTSSFVAPRLPRHSPHRTDSHQQQGFFPIRHTAVDSRFGHIRSFTPELPSPCLPGGMALRQTSCSLPCGGTQS